MTATSKGGMPPKFTPKSEFIDVTSKTSYYMNINSLFHNGWTKGSKTTKGYVYSPEGKTTREFLAVLIYRILGKPAYTPPKKATYKDVPTTYGYYKELSWAVSKGILQYYTVGKTKELRPKAALTNEMLAIALFKATASAKSYKAPKKSLFLDVTTKHKNYVPISWVKENKIHNASKTGKGYNFKPTSILLRKATAACLNRWAKYLYIQAPAAATLPNASYKINSTIDSKVQGSIKLSSLVAKRFTVASSVDILRSANSKGWQKWIEEQFAMTDSGDIAWLKTYSKNST